MMQNLKIRFAIIEDLPQIVSILNQAVRARVNGVLEEQNAEQRLKWFTNFGKDKHPIYVAEIDNRIVGYCYLSPYRSGRQAMSKIAEISYYIDTNYHRKGVATSLIQHVIDDCHRLGKDSLLAVLLDINSPSIELLKKFNFNQWGHYPDVIDLNGKRCGQLIYGLKL
jgi:phosphinothricin acetyltransferase